MLVFKMIAQMLFQKQCLVQPHATSISPNTLRINHALGQFREVVEDVAPQVKSHI